MANPMLKIMLLLALLMPAQLMAKRFSDDDPARIYMVVWRGCEEACQGFKKYLREQQLPVELVVRDVAKNKQLLPQVIQEIKLAKPDLVVTWGTSVSKALIGPIDGAGKGNYITDIPMLFMVVADPISAGIIESYQQSGRELVTGIRNRVPETVQIQVMKDYLEVKKIGVVTSPAELNSVLNAEQLQKLSQQQGFELVDIRYQLDESGRPVPDQLPGIMAQMAAENVDIVYVGSSSYNRQNRDAFTQAALAYGLPVASAYEVMVTKSQGLLAVANRYYNVGRLAASQAEKVLFSNIKPGDLPIASLNRYSIFINMAVARQLKAFPPIQLLKLAELINARPTRP